MTQMEIESFDQPVMNALSVFLYCNKYTYSYFFGWRHSDIKVLQEKKFHINDLQFTLCHASGI